jgi:hypothetical protein
VAHGAAGPFAGLAALQCGFSSLTNCLLGETAQAVRALRERRARSPHDYRSRTVPAPERRIVRGRAGHARICSLRRVPGASAHARANEGSTALLLSPRRCHIGRRGYLPGTPRLAERARPPGSRDSTVISRSARSLAAPTGLFPMLEGRRRGDPSSGTSRSSHAKVGASKDVHPKRRPLNANSSKSAARMRCHSSEAPSCTTPTFSVGRRFRAQRRSFITNSRSERDPPPAPQHIGPIQNHAPDASEKCALHHLRDRASHFSLALRFGFEFSSRF